MSTLRETATAVIDLMKRSERGEHIDLSHFKGVKVGSVPNGTELQALFLEVFQSVAQHLTDEQVALLLFELLQFDGAVDVIFEEGGFTA